MRSSSISTKAPLAVVKPAVNFYLDIGGVRRTSRSPGGHLSGLGESTRYSCGGAAQYWIGKACAVQSRLTGIRRAGADIVLTYWAVDAAGWLT